jgi:hypothetical protein
MSNCGVPTLQFIFSPKPSWYKELWVKALRTWCRIHLSEKPFWPQATNPLSQTFPQLEQQTSGWQSGQVGQNADALSFCNQTNKSKLSRFFLERGEPSDFHCTLCRFVSGSYSKPLLSSFVITLFSHSKYVQEVHADSLFKIFIAHFRDKLPKRYFG